MGFLAFGAYAQVGLPPAIIVQPADQIVLGRDRVTFSVSASSGTAMSYKWYHDGTVIPSATASSYAIASVTMGVHDGDYYVEVRNVAGTTVSRTARLTILASNDIPVVNHDSYTTQEDVALNIPPAGILTNDSDVYPGFGLSALLVNNVSNVTLNFNTNGSLTYTPSPGYNGSDSFTYRTRDGGTTILENDSSGGNKQEIKKDEPGAQSFRHGTNGDVAYSIKKVVLRLSKKAGQNHNLNFSIGTGVNSGPLAGSSYTITMASISNTTGGSSFQNYDIVYNTPVGPLTAGTTYYLNLDNRPNGKEVFVEYAGSSTYPRGTYYKGGDNDGKDMRFEIHEETFSGPATVTLNVTPVYDPPVAVPDSTNTLEDVSVTINVLANDRSPDGLPLTVINTLTSNGTAVVTGTNIVFTPAPNFYGIAVFSYTLSDGASFATASVTVNVAPVSDYPPVANDDTYSTAEDTTLIIRAPGLLANDYDGDGDAVTALLVSNVSNGSLDLHPDGSFTYVPNADYHGSDSFTYCAMDGAATGNLATVTITVSPTKDALRFISQRMTTNGCELVLSGPVRSTYIILASTNFTDWAPISTNYTEIGNVVFTDIRAANRAGGFYRATVSATNSVLGHDLNSPSGSTASSEK